MISLKGIKPGTKVRINRGEILEFKRFTSNDDDYLYIFEYNGTNYLYTNEGKMYKEEETPALDITEILNEEENTMDNYQTEDVDYTGCDPIIRQALENNKRILCHVSDVPFDSKNTRNVDAPVWIAEYIHNSESPYFESKYNKCGWKYARPVVKKQTYIMPPERAIPILIENGWGFSDTGSMVS